MLGGDGRWLVHGVSAVPGLSGFVESERSSTGQECTLHPLS